MGGSPAGKRRWRTGLRLLVLGAGLGMVVLLPAQAANNNAGLATFSATIQPGTCSVALDSGQSTIDLKSVSSGSVVAGHALLSSDGTPQVLDVSCTGYPSGASVPNLTVSGTNVAGSSTLFREAGAAGGTNPSVSLGVQVQAASVGPAPSDWSGVSFMTNGTPLPVDVQGHNADGSQVPVRFSMWCVPAGGKTVTDCQSGGTVTAKLTFTLEYK